MTNWTLTEKGRMLLEEYVTQEIGFKLSDIKESKLLNDIMDEDFINVLDEKIDRKSVYATQAVSMKQLARCFSKKSVVWGIKMNLLAGILLYERDLPVNELSKKLKVTQATVNGHITILESCDLVKKTDVTTHLSDFL